MGDVNVVAEAIAYARENRWLSFGGAVPIYEHCSILADRVERLEAREAVGYAFISDIRGDIERVKWHGRKAALDPDMFLDRAVAYLNPPTGDTL